MEEKSDIFFHRKLRKKCYFRLILIISLYIIKLVLIFFLFLIYFYRRDVMTCLLLFQLHERSKYVGIILKILKNRTKVPLSRHQKCEKWKCKNFQERIRLHKYEKYLKIILQLFKTYLVYRYFNLKKKKTSEIPKWNCKPKTMYLLPFVTPSTLAIVSFALHNLFHNTPHAITIEINPTLTGSYKTGSSTQFQRAKDIRKSGVERLWEASK